MSKCRRSLDDIDVELKTARQMLILVLVLYVIAVILMFLTT